MHRVGGVSRFGTTSVHSDADNPARAGAYELVRTRVDDFEGRQVRMWRAFLVPSERLSDDCGGRRNSHNRGVIIARPGDSPDTSTRDLVVHIVARESRRHLCPGTKLLPPS